MLPRNEGAREPHRRDWADRSNRTRPLPSAATDRQMKIAGMDYPIPEFSAMLPTPDTKADLEKCAWRPVMRPCAKSAQEKSFAT
jgi:hypothetical protein